MEAIQAVNRELLSHMETLGLGDAFLAMAPFIKLYSTYANNFANAQADLQVKIQLTHLRSFPSIALYIPTVHNFTSH